MADDYITYREVKALFDTHADRVEIKIDQLGDDINKKFDSRDERVREIEDQILTMKVNTENKKMQERAFQGLLAFVISTIISLISIFWRK